MGCGIVQSIMKETIQLDINHLVNGLTFEDKLRLARRLERETWGAQLDKVVQRIRKRPSVQKLTMRDITRIVEEVREAGYVRSSRRS